MDPGSPEAALLPRANLWSSGDSSGRSLAGMETNVVTNELVANRRATLCNPNRGGATAGVISRQADFDVDNTTQFRDNSMLKNAGSPPAGVKNRVAHDLSGRSAFVTDPNCPSNGYTIL